MPQLAQLFFKTAIVFLIVLGAATANLFGRTIVSYGELLLGQMPLVRTVYRGLKQIFNTVLSEKTNTFQKVGLVQYPRQGLWAIVFIATEAEGEIQHRLDEEHAGQSIAVFLPTTPNPTSGFLLFVPRKDIMILDMSVEEAAKLVISAGLVTPEYQKKTAELAEGATPLVQLVDDPKKAPKRSRKTPDAAE